MTSANTFYRQCTMTRSVIVENDKVATTAQVAWIPEIFARVGKFVKLKDEDGWLVKEAGSKRLSGEYLAQHEREYLNHRKVTDV